MSFAFALCSLLLLSTGCAVCYCDRDHNSEELWGVGKLKIKLQKLSDQTVVAARYKCVPGVCLEISWHRFGINFGELVEERSTVLFVDSVNSLDAINKSRVVKLSRNSESPWNFGWQKTFLMQEHSNELAVCEGKSSWGMNCGVGGLGSNFGVGYSSMQRTLLFTEGEHLNIDQDAKNWTGFNLYNAIVTGGFENRVYKTQTSNNENN